MTTTKVTVEWHPSPYGLAGEVPRYRCSCGELHNGAQAAHQCRHRDRAMPRSHGRQSVPSLFDQEDHDHA